VDFHPIAKRRKHPRDLVQSLWHSIPLDLKAVAVVDDVAKSAERPKWTRQGGANQLGQGRSWRLAESMEQLQVPVLAGRQLQAMKAA
jgi:hypothetical protein